MTPRPDSRVGMTLGPYRIEAVLGRGGMGIVYLATDVRLDRRVGLKLLSPELADDAAFRARFLRESRLAASIDDPNIIPVYEAGETDGLFYIAMRYVEGTDLAKRLQEGPLDAAVAIHLLAQVASALDAAHERGLVHRDVKPANILVAPGKGPGRPEHAYLSDFGLTKQRGSETGITQAGAFLGTLDYIAPEQIEGKPVDGRADQYALACMAFQCLTGSVPFIRNGDAAILMAHLRDAPPSAVARQPTLAPSADAVLARGMAKRPDDRFPSDAAFVGALREALGVRSTEVGTEPIALARSTRPTVFAAAAIVGLLILVVAAGWAIVVSGASRTVAQPPGVATASVSPGASTSSGPAASPTIGPFPTNAETALLKALPASLSKTCMRGSYNIVYADLAQVTGTAPLASLTCAQAVATGANEVTIRRFKDPGLSISEFTTEGAISRIEHPIAGPIGPGSTDPRDLPPGDCATSTRAGGRWQLSGQDAGAIACYVEGPTGDAILWWSYKNKQILIQARNQRGDSASLYGYFQQIAQFIAP